LGRRRRGKNVAFLQLLKRRGKKGKKIWHFCNLWEEGEGEIKGK